MKAIIKTVTVGSGFGTIGVIYAVRKDGRRGRILAETRVFPYQFDGPASSAAESIAERLGLTIA